ncbi:uncharacterized protein LOC111342211 [Stylophora pistillata]|uniref:uncharacterized protein LOC111342211 n=1 Tax=Stylophora pistillata TaxID=50429 RepID=UPI000C03AAAA|nr:uncharacterized protein LOC111342211 [Stylophora pistillata]
MESSEATRMQQESEVSLIIIPVHKFDRRNVLVKKIFAFSLEKKRPMPIRSQSDENLQSSIASRKVLCHVISDTSRGDGYFNTEPYCLEFRDETNNFILTTVTDRDGTAIECLKDLHREEKPWGALLMNEAGEFVGMLAVGTSQHKKLYPLFLPTLAQDNQSCKEDQEAVHPSSDPPYNHKEQVNSNLANLDQKTGNGCSSKENGISDKKSPMLVDLPKPEDAYPGQDELPDNSNLPLPEKDFVVDDQCDQGSLDGPESGLPSWEANRNAHQQSGQNLATQHSYHSALSLSTQGHGVRETLSLPPDKDRPPANPSSTETVPSQSHHGDTDLAASVHRSQSDVFGPGTPNQSPQMTRHNTVPRGRREHIMAGSFVKDKIVDKEDVMDVLVLHLDRSVCFAPGIPAIQRWVHLADQFKVPDDVKSQCADFSGKLSSSEALFEHLCAVQDALSVGEIKKKLKKLGRNDVVAELEKNSKLTDKSTVTDLYEKHPETMCSICIKLDNKHSIKNWYHLGIEIGIKAGTLRRLRDPSGDSPSEVVLKMIQTRKPRLPLKKLAEVINLPGVTNALAGFPDNSTIETLLGNMDAMENVTTLMDPDGKWQRVGQHYNIDQRILDNLKPGDVQSPTKTVLEYVVKREPTTTMETFLTSLKNMRRFDVIEDLKEFFYGDDIDRILRAGGSGPS